MSSVKHIQAVANACAVVEAIAANQPVGVSELARLTGLDKSGVQRITVTLHEVGWLVPVPGTMTRWQIAPDFAALAAQAGAIGLIAAARPVMARLRDEVNETVMIVAIEGDRLEVLEVMESRQATRVSVAPGTEFPIGSSAAGRAIAAHLPARRLSDLRAHHPDLRPSWLDQVRSRGWTIDGREVDPHARTIAAAVLAPSGTAVAALVVCGPASRLSPELMPELGARCAAAAAEVSGVDEPTNPRAVGERLVPDRAGGALAPAAAATHLRRTP